MNQVEEEIIRAVAEDQVTRGTKTLARKVIAERDALAGHPARHTEAPPAESRKAVVARIRAAVFERANGRCEFCAARRAAHPEHQVQAPKEWHHVCGGGLRRKLESVETTAAICTDCHRGWGRGDLSVLFAAGAWALGLGFRAAYREIVHRIDKVNEARRSTARRNT